MFYHVRITPKSEPGCRGRHPGGHPHTNRLSRGLTYVLQVSKDQYLMGVEFRSLAGYFMLQSSSKLVAGIWSSYTL